MRKKLEMLRNSRYTGRRKGEAEINKKIRNDAGRSEKGKNNEEEREKPFMALHLPLPEIAI